MEVAGEQQRQARQYDRRAYLQRKAVAMEELAPKPTGRYVGEEARTSGL